MANIPAYCKRCRLVFESPMAIVWDVQLSSIATRCPNCGRVVEIGDGKYSSLPEDVRQLHVANATKETQQLTNIYNQIVARDLERLKSDNPQAFAKVESVAQQVANDTISEKVAAELIAAYLPKESADAVKRLAKTGGLKSFLKQAIVAGGLAYGALKGGTDLIEAGGKVYDRLFSPATQTQSVTAPTPPVMINAPVTINTNITINPPPSVEPPMASLSKEQIRRLKQRAKAQLKMAPLPPRRPSVL